LRFGSGYKGGWGSERRDLPLRVARFFGTAGFETRRFDNPQYLDLEGLTGRLLSSSYAPLRGHPNHDPMIAALGELFGRFAEGGRVSIEYDTHVYWGRPAA
jgi:hypothetical protein